MFIGSILMSRWPKGPEWDKSKAKAQKLRLIQWGFEVNSSNVSLQHEKLLGWPPEPRKPGQISMNLGQSCELDPRLSKNNIQGMQQRHIQRCASHISPKKNLFTCKSHLPSERGMAFIKGPFYSRRLSSRFTVSFMAASRRTFSNSKRFQRRKRGSFLLSRYKRRKITRLCLSLLPNSDRWRWKNPSGTSIKTAVNQLVKTEV